MSSDVDNLQSISFTLMSIKPKYGIEQTGADTWPKVGGRLNDEEDFGKQFKKKLATEEVLIGKAKELPNDDKKIAYLFNEVKNTLKWNGVDRWYTNDGVVKAWTNKSGNSTEINLILYRLLKQAGVKAYPMVVSTRDHGKVNPFNPLLGQFNRAVVYIPVDSTKHYVLDATSKYNLYNEIPDNLLNSSGLYIDKEMERYDLIFLKNDAPVRQMVYTKAEVKPDGKMTGVTQISSFSYNKINRTSKYKGDGEEKFIEYLRNNDNNLKITALKCENADADSLPRLYKI
ncbi:hypothetical protein DJ568_02505 [Mucilaginibacter hurinus]|uniref:Transglutaminase-like domain-containing protein n=1 Tax=Mucilaginibacter hurinus TaxID=2201324 RepID=A0A367GUJ6_9SPHI|nr:hypothetical protein [Mucilaginibacter hurinus]RCH56745.1 hypothetical protein DJ568_02505 [Mucilaginibacter hurinus]